MSKRFLRDNILDEMLHEIRNISETITDSQFPTLMFSQSLAAISEMYETNKTVLHHLEEVIEQLREKEVDDQVLDQVVNAAAHVQIGLMSVHSALKNDVESLLNGIESLRSTLEIEEKNKEILIKPHTP